uniref:Uncharacterized protein n=1 Tax=Magallana gigas TaxID=29159 RepID=K1QJP2_MAGGI
MDDSAGDPDLAFHVSVLESLVCALSPIKLIVCNGGAARGISFSQAKASEGLQIEKQEPERNKSETDWAARLAIHFFSPLSQTKDYVLDNHGLKKCERCPCSCNKIIRYGDTSIGNPKTWYGRFNIFIGKFAHEESCEESNKQRCDEIDIGATVVPTPENPDTDDESLSNDGPSQTEVKTDGLNNHLSHLFSQTIVLSFYQKKCNPALNIVPLIGVSKTHIQFHFYDSEKDVYLASKQMPLFYKNKTLQIPTVIATWLVLNYKHLSSDYHAGCLRKVLFETEQRPRKDLTEGEVAVTLTEHLLGKLAPGDSYVDDGKARGNGPCLCGCNESPKYRSTGIGANKNIKDKCG